MPRNEAMPMSIRARVSPWLGASAIAAAAGVVAEGIAAALASTGLGIGDVAAITMAAAAAHGLLWGSVGVLAGVVHAPLDTPASLRTAFATLVRRGAGEDRIAASIYAAGVIVGLFAALAYPLSRFFLTAFHNEQLAAAALAVVVVSLASVLLLLFFVVSGVIERVLRRRRSGRGTTATAPRALGTILGLGVVTASALAWQWIESIRQISWGAPALGLALFSVLLTARELLLSTTGKRGDDGAATGRIASLLAVCGAVLAVSGYAGAWWTLPSRPVAVGAATADTLLLARLMPLLQGRDSDGDGFRPYLGGGDCDDTDPAVGPGAIDIAGNGIDEDCDGADLSALPITAEPDPGGPASAPVATMAKVRNMVLITVDTLRADRLKAYGGRRGVTPTLDRLAARAVSWRHAYTPASFTPKAIPTMLGARHPGEIHRNYGHFSRYLPANLSFVEILAARGFRTAGFASHWYFRPGYGFAQGFEHWDTSVVPADRSTMEIVSLATTLTDRAVRYLREHADDDTRFLLWVHYFDPHKLYTPPAEFDRFGGSQEDKYDGEVAYVDDEVGRLLAAIAALPDAADTAVVFTSDHGEAFGEHGMRFHGHHLWEELVRVPLIIHVPVAPGECAGRIVERRVGLVDLAPTMLELLDIAWPEEAPTPRGVSLVAEMLPGGAIPERPIWIDHPPGPYNAAVRAFVAGNLKLHHYVAAGHFRLYDLSTDPLEKTDIYGRDPETDRAMVDKYKRFLAGLEELRVGPP